MMVSLLFPSKVVELASLLCASDILSSSLSTSQNVFRLSPLCLAEIVQ